MKQYKSVSVSLKFDLIQGSEISVPLNRSAVQNKAIQYNPLIHGSTQPPLQITFSLGTPNICKFYVL